jgi:SSS family transporter
MTYLVVLTVYMVVLVLIGLLSSRRLGGVEDFYIGGRKVGPWVTALSFVAAYFSAVLIIGGGAFGYKYGMATIWIGAINVLLGCTLCWIVLGPRIRTYTKRLGTMTIPDFLGESYGSNAVRLFASVVIFIFLIIYNVSILKGMGHIFEILVGMSYIHAVILSAIVILFYVAIGGYLAVVWTGFFQGWVMIFGLLLLTFTSVWKAGGMTQVHFSLRAIDPGLVSSPGVWGWAGLISFALIVSFGVWGMPQLVVRFYSIKSVNVLRIGTLIVTLGGCIALLPYFNGAISRTLLPRLSNPDLAIPTLTKMVLSPLGGAIFLSAVVAAGMSTFASVLIIASSSVVRDLVQKGLGKEISPGRTMTYNRLLSVVVGLASLLIALRPPSLILVLCAFSWAAIASTCLWPLLFAVYWRKASGRTCMASMILGCSTALTWMSLGNPHGIHGFIPGILIAAVPFLFSMLVPSTQFRQ